MTSLQLWESCVAEMKKTKKVQRPFMFIKGADLDKVQKCYCTVSKLKKSKRKVKK